MVPPSGDLRRIAGLVASQEGDAGLAFQHLWDAGGIVELDLSLNLMSAAVAKIGRAALHARHSHGRSHDLALVYGRTAAEGDLDRSAWIKAIEMQFVNLGEDAQLAHIDN